MAVIHQRASVAQTRSVTFGYVNDYRHVPEWMFGVTKFEPTTDVTFGLGAIFDGAMTLGPKSFKATFECTEWIENELIVLTSVKGFDSATRWVFTDSADGKGTDVEAEFTYNLPGGLAGRALGAIIEPLVGQGVRHTESTLKEKVEALG